jgi:hypothetical protein
MKAWLFVQMYFYVLAFLADHWKKNRKKELSTVYPCAVAPVPLEIIVPPTSALYTAKNYFNFRKVCPRDLNVKINKD